MIAQPQQTAFQDMTPKQTAARVMVIVENYVAPALRRKAADAITDLLVDTQQAICSAALEAFREANQP